MGIMTNELRFLMAARLKGVSFRQTLTIGRQNLYIDLDEFEQLFREYAVFPGGNDWARIRAAHAEFVDPFLRLLGAEEVDSLDISRYEGATIIHDLDQPIAPELASRFDVVIESGSLEHVFHFPAAIGNCMRMVKPGGHFILTTPANNQCGHGFYQFSPELVFRVFSEANGFAVERMIVHEDFVDCQWYEVADPAQTRTRIELVNTLPSMLKILARKTREVSLFEASPRQSDYVPVWSGARQVFVARRSRSLLPPPAIRISSAALPTCSADSQRAPS